MKKKKLSERAAGYALRLGYSETGGHGSLLCKGWLAGYKAAQKDAHEKTYSRKICPFCAKEKDGHKHDFCSNCKRIIEHCDCTFGLNHI